MSNSSFKSYIRHWNYFSEFLHSVLHQKVYLPIHSQHIAMFIAHLHTKDLQHSTIKSYLSALSFIHKAGNLPDPVNTHLVRKSMIGIKNLQTVKTSMRLPITKHVLKCILSAIPYATNNPYMQCMYRALFLLTYYACLRVGEVVLADQKLHVLQIQQLTPVKSDTGVGYDIAYKSYKHSHNQTPTLRLLASKDKPCPVNALSSFLAVRSSGDGQVFIDQRNQPITRKQFSKFLKVCLQIEGYSFNNYNTHSFRIGRVTELAKANALEAIIKSTGRWKSSAFQKYIRPSYFTLPQ